MTVAPPPRAFPLRWKTLLILGIVVATLLLVVRLSVVFTPLLIAFLLTYILNPVVTKLERWMPRVAAISVLFVLFLVALVLVVGVGMPALVREGIQFVDEGFVGERILDDKNKDGIRDPGEPFEDWNKNGRFDPPRFHTLSALSARIQDLLGTHDWKEAYEKFSDRLRGGKTDILGALRDVASTIIKTAMNSIKGVLLVLSFLVFTPIDLFFLLKNMNRWWAKFQKLIPYSYRDQAIRTLTRIHQANAAFFRGQITIAAIEGCIVCVVLYVIGVKMALLFGVMYACLAIIPYVGVVTVFTLTSIFVLADPGSTSRLYGVAGLFVFIQLLENLVLQPLILGKETGLHPMAIIIALFVFADLFGFLGILLAVPLASMTIILAQEYLMPLLREGERSGETATYKLPLGGPPQL